MLLRTRQRRVADMQSGQSDGMLSIVFTLLSDFLVSLLLAPSAREEARQSRRR